MLVGFMVLNATFNNISVTSCRSVLLVEKTRVPGENLSQVTEKLNPIITNQLHFTPPLSTQYTHTKTKIYDFVIEVLIPDLTTGFKAYLNNEIKPCTFIKPNLYNSLLPVNIVISSSILQQYITYQDR